MGFPSIRQLAPRPTPADAFQNGGYRGSVLRAPASFADRLTVVLDALPDVPWDCAWLPRPNDATVSVPTAGTSTAGGGAITFTASTLAAAPPVLPSEGDPCLVVFDDGGDAWAWVSNQ